MELLRGVEPLRWTWQAHILTVKYDSSLEPQLGFEPTHAPYDGAYCPTDSGLVDTQGIEPCLLVCKARALPLHQASMYCALSTLSLEGWLG